MLANPFFRSYMGWYIWTCVSLVYIFVLKHQELRWIVSSFRITTVVFHTHIQMSFCYIIRKSFIVSFFINHSIRNGRMERTTKVNNSNNIISWYNSFNFNKIFSSDQIHSNKIFRNAIDIYTDTIWLIQFEFYIRR